MTYQFYAGLIFKICNYIFMNVVIPIPCPSCGGKMYLVSYEAPLRILKERSWQICKECGFERSTDEFKKMLCCA